MQYGTHLLTDTRAAPANLAPNATVAGLDSYCGRVQTGVSASDPALVLASWVLGQWVGPPLPTRAAVGRLQLRVRRASAAIIAACGCADAWRRPTHLARNGTRCVDRPVTLQGLSIFE